MESGKVNVLLYVKKEIIWELTISINCIKFFLTPLKIYLRPALNKNVKNVWMERQVVQV